MNLPKVSSRTVLWRIWGFDIQDASEMRYAAMVSIYVRWGCLFAALVETSYRTLNTDPSATSSTRCTCLS